VGHQHRVRCHRHQHFGISGLTPVPSGTRLCPFISVSTVRSSRHQGVPETHQLPFCVAQLRGRHSSQVQGLPCSWRAREGKRSSQIHVDLSQPQQMATSTFSPSLAAPTRWREAIPVQENRFSQIYGDLSQPQQMGPVPSHHH
jgi:hypothetical protein